MTHVPYLIAGWGITALAFAVYAGSVMARAKRVSARVPAERQRWMTGNDADVIGET